MQLRIAPAVAAISTTLFLCLSASALRADEINVVASSALKAAFNELVPVFEKASGHKLILPYDPSAVGRSKLASGEAFDVAIVDRASFQELVSKGLRLAAPFSVLAVNSAQLAYTAGKPKPDVSSPEALKATVLAAKSMSYSDPALGGSSSNYFVGVAEKLGILEQVRAKAIVTKPGQGAFPVGEGRAEIGIAQASEVALVKGVAGIDIFPEDPRSRSVYAIGVSASAAHPAGAQAFVAFLKSPEAVALMKSKGLQPPD